MACSPECGGSASQHPCLQIWVCTKPHKPSQKISNERRGCWFTKDTISGQTLWYFCHSCNIDDLLPLDLPIVQESETVFYIYNGKMYITQNLQPHFGGIKYSHTTMHLSPPCISRASSSSQTAALFPWDGDPQALAPTINFPCLRM